MHCGREQMKEALISLVEGALAQSMPLLVLRGGDILARADGDIDILVPQGRSIQACLLLVTAAKQEGWALLSFRDIGYVSSVVLVMVKEEGNDIAVKVDFVSGLEWFGVGDGTVSARFFEHLLRDAVTPEARGALAGSITFFQKWMGIGVLSERDWRRVIMAGADKAYLLRTASELGLPLSQADLTAQCLGLLAKWRLRFASAGGGGGGALLIWLAKIVGAYLRYSMRCGFYSGNVLGLSGLDGCGKSTQVERLVASYVGAGVSPPRLVHLLPKWIPMPHQLLRRRTTVDNYLRPYSEAPVSSVWSGGVRLTYYLLAFAISRLAIESSAQHDKVYVFDRSFVDFAADPARARIPFRRLPVWLTRAFAPRGCLIYLDAGPETVVRRKGELTLEKANDLRRRYLDVFASIGGTLISAEGTPSEVYRLIMQQIDGVFFRRLTEAAARRSA